MINISGKVAGYKDNTTSINNIEGTNTFLYSNNEHAEIEFSKTITFKNAQVKKK